MTGEGISLAGTKMERRRLRSARQCVRSLFRRRSSADKPGKVRHGRTYTLKPGMAHVYNEGDLHSPKRSGPTGLIRIEGTNMDKVKRLKYEVA